MMSNIGLLVIAFTHLITINAEEAKFIEPITENFSSDDSYPESSILEYSIESATKLTNDQHHQDRIGKTLYKTDSRNDIEKSNKIDLSDVQGTKSQYHHQPIAKFRDSIFSKQATHFIVASKLVRPGIIYKVSVSILEAKHPITVHASISHNGVEISGDTKEVKKGIPENLLMRIPTSSTDGDYKLRVKGFYANIHPSENLAFLNETNLSFSQRSLTIFVEMDKPFYRQGDSVRFRTIPISTELKGYDKAIDVFMLDPQKRVLRRWLSRLSYLGSVSLEYKLSDQPVFGEWTVRVVAQGQVEESPFFVEEYYQTRFEVNVTMPESFLISKQFIAGKVMANFTSGAPVKGNLTLRAILAPIGSIDYRALNEQYRVGRTSKSILNASLEDVKEHTFTFDEKWPFWLSKPDSGENLLPYLRYFNGTYDFQLPLTQLQEMTKNLDGMELLIIATVGERFYNEIISGYSLTRLYSPTLKAAFLGGQVQVFKPCIAFTAHIVVENQDESPLGKEFLDNTEMIVTGSIQSKSGAQEYPLQKLQMSKTVGIWDLKIDLLTDMDLEKEFLSGVLTMKLEASYRDVKAELLLITHHSPRNQFIGVTTSTEDPEVGEYIIFHIRTNFFVRSFNYLIVSKGVVILSDEETMEEGSHTMAVTLCAEMAPVATIIVWKVTQQGQVVADSLSFPVNGLSRNNFNLHINNRKSRTGERVEVAVYGEPGSFVGLSAIDNTLKGDLNKMQILEKMTTFDGRGSGIHSHTFFGLQDKLVSYSATSFGIDPNRTFELCDLLIFTDAEVPRKWEPAWSFYDSDVKDQEQNKSELMSYRKYRFNRVQRHYDNVWLWKDVNIGPHGRFIFTVSVPDGPAYWMVTAFSVSPSRGFGIVDKPVQYIGEQPFYINVEMPLESRQGEQVGIRVTVFNYRCSAIEATVVLHASHEYKFVHVEEDGVVAAYNPRTSFGEQQFFVYLEAQSSSIVYVPIVPTRLGEIDVTIHAATLLGTDQVTRRLKVEPDGLPQYRHQSILLDLSNRAYLFQYMHLNITETPIIPYQVDRYFVYGSNSAKISVVGDVVGPIFPTMPVNATSLLNLPMECAEQNAFSFAVNLYTVMYMRLINQRNKTIEKNAFHHLNIAYQRQLSFMRDDGSFSLFRSDWNNSESSVWLTAYCVRTFQEAAFYEWENYIYIDPTVIENGIVWLLQHQGPEGGFFEVTWLPDRKMNHSNIANRNISLTAHVLITLATVKDLSGSLGARVVLAQQRALYWIERNMQLLEKTPEAYDVAITAYALQLCKAPIAEHAFAILRKHAKTIGEYIYWGRDNLSSPPSKIENQKYFSLPRLPYEFDSMNIETTAYALLVYVQRREFMVDPIVKWLNAQRLTDGGWASTQDTGAALKALIEYTVYTRIRDVSALSISLEATSLQDQTKSLFIDDSNLAQLQSVDIPNAWGTVKVQAKGTGYAILQLHVQYNVDNPKFQTKPPVPAFSLQTNALFQGRNHSHISYECCQSWTHLNESERSGMAILDVTIPTGYYIQQQKLDSYVLGKSVRNLRRAKFMEKKIVFYFDYLDNTDICLNFTVERWFPVANMSRYLPIRVYDYYAPERFNETIFDALPTYLLNICEVCGSSQCPYCIIYSKSSKSTISLAMMTISISLVYFVAQSYKINLNYLFFI
ncbi:CD109 antigen-like [Episyrphus balteatus]|uniref:CD109 antigen-like n=1 Tax=Episyrphus balteatus TaxID=286459 RepID=UPI0024869A8F|nr:CD109 antigen-like [Episyrphus balteatus]XP_055836831.1 CD109 antigen-like [Episyrphus balteatus]